MRNNNEQRIRDPLHDLITFEDNGLDQVLWEAVQSRPFQRLRRVKQLGFSELVYPGATHTRFAHSIGVYHTAKLLMKTIHKQIGNNAEFNDGRRDQAIAASLLHDLGHGPFSHAFEVVGGRMGWENAKHEDTTIRIIKETEIFEILNGIGSSGFANDVAGIISDP